MTGVSALADSTSKDLLVTSSKRRFAEARKQKPSRKVHSKVLHQAIDPFAGGPCPAVVARGVTTDDLPLASNVLTSPDVRSLPPTKTLPVLQNLPQFHPLVRFLFPEDLQCRYSLAGRLKYFRKIFEKLSSDQAVLNMISGNKVTFSEVPRQSKYPRQISMSIEKSLSVDTEIQALLEKGAIKMIDSSHDNSIFLVEKKDSSQSSI